ncbi:MAG TPA: hypothetical protein VN030_04470 [Cellvibrio sp.]|nr:hypothetical protein [Cellvibrio sp.]
MSDLGYSGDQVAASIHQASMNAAMQPGGAPAGAGLAGALIGGSIVQSSAVSAAQKAKNAPVRQFLSTLSELDLASVFKSSKFSDHYSMPDDAEQGQRSDKKLVLVPTLEVSANYRTLNLNVAASIVGKGGKVFYKNFFQVQSDSLLEDGELLDALNGRSAQELEVRVREMADVLPGLIKQDFEGWPNNNLTESVSIKFKNGMGEYFERGYILQTNEKTIVIKSLRGEVKQFSFMNML